MTHRVGLIVAASLTGLIFGRPALPRLVGVLVGDLLYGFLLAFLRATGIVK